MRCLYCDGKLPLYRKITHGQFCSTAHRKAYWQEQERLAVERLHQTHNSLRAHRPTVPAEAILGPAEATVAGVATAALSGFVATLQVPHNGGGPRMVVTDPQEYELPQLLEAPLWTLPEPAPRELPSAGAMSLRWVPEPQRLALPSSPEPSLREVSIPICRPVGNFSLSTKALPAAAATEIPFAAEPRSAAIAVQSVKLEPATVRVPAPFIDVPFHAAPEPLEMPPAPEEVYPFADHLFTLEKFAAAKLASGPVAFLQAISTQAISANAQAALPSGSPLRIAGARLELGMGNKCPSGSVVSPQALPKQVISATQIIAAKPQAILLGEGSMTLAARLQLGMGKGSRYPIQIRATHTRSVEPEPADLSVLPPEIALPDRGAEAVLQAAEQTIDAFVPEPAVALLPLAFGMNRTAVKLEAPRTMVVSTIPQPLRTKPVLPKSRLEPMNPRPVFEIPEIPAPLLAEAAAVPALHAQNAQPQPEQKHIWSHAAEFWKHAPRDLKILVFAIPALLVLAFHPPLPKVGFSVPAAAGTSTGQVTQNVSTAVRGQWASVRQAVFDRAAVALDEDFRTGLDDWSSRGDATAQWSFDATGFVRPGPLALYRPSMNLRDYQMQFLGLIDKKALSWVVRAQDFDNYYVVKMVVLKPGPLTTLGITRYAVIDGKAQDRSDTIVPIDARPDMLYRVTMDVHDDTFALSIQGQMTDSWSEPRLSKGGVGFFNSKGEESRVRWVQVTHQYDMLGRLCAYLAPYNIPTNGSW